MMKARNEAETTTSKTVTVTFGEESKRRNGEPETTICTRTVTVTLDESKRNEPEISMVTETEESTTNEPETNTSDDILSASMVAAAIDPSLKEAIVMDREANVINFYACISMNSDRGVQITNLDIDDIIRIDSIQGDGSFEGSSKDRPIQQGFITITQGIKSDGEALYNANEAEAKYEIAQRGTIELLQSTGPVVKKKRRDGNGQDRDTFDYAKDEGGIIVCPPEAMGPVFSNNDNKLKDGAKKQGRKVEFYSDSIRAKNCFFPCFGVLGNQQETRIINTDGRLYMLAFDKKDDFRDNAGCYVVQGRIFRRDYLNR